MFLIRSKKVKGLSFDKIFEDGDFEDVGYWRKANQIHRWFVENIQHNIDNCAMYYVSKESLCELKELCEKVLEDKKLANELLPVGRGFFFGSVEYDEWYFKDLEYTVEKLDELLKNEKYDFYKYQSDW